MLYNQEYFNPTSEKEEVLPNIYTSAPVWAAQLFLILSHSTHMYILGNKWKKKRSKLNFYTSAFFFFLLYNTWPEQPLSMGGLFHFFLLWNAVSLF